MCEHIIMLTLIQTLHMTLHDKGYRRLLLFFLYAFCMGIKRSTTPYSYSEELLSKWYSNVVQTDKPTRDKHCFEYDLSQLPYMEIFGQTT